ncbi:FtsL-like putative cell division protein [Lentimicrobium sp.]|jgi:hypothetical protein|uniref:FtsL-like putative cell division protein n=1 Tax=Lentimicrobium sp. TaxID=2034841 RepID=UPI0025F8E5ED|nr:FtsL-like putative cell division protein [Lentimicrobium sp.]MCO5257035.1 FtsL-like putative cell division protein [Lentimicrobium sp.]MCO5263383.1 FtsL-like putative cell division protein [Lentimicrobium sp.]HOP13289.1 FtsL-like putative cell division protein [Lentimicrobium sp.]HPF64907.1 FtsL-like putative cell division protein [Lentimicrobium sp.]HPJ61368.1 FtsL-like putative cell division protein [Lentimicrobium sp.]
MSSARNTLKPKPAEKPAPKRRLKAFTTLNRKVHVGSSLHSIVDGSFLTRDNLVKQVPFILFLTLIAIFYIANSFNAEKTIIDISRTKKELQELRYEYITTKSNLMFHSKQSEVASRLKNSGLKESLEPPVKIYQSEK